LKLVVTLILYQGNPAVAQLLLVSHCKIDLQRKDGLSVLQVPQGVGHAAIVTLIWNTKQNGADHVLLQVSPEEIQEIHGVILFLPVSKYRWDTQTARTGNDEPAPVSTSSR
jgi:hypothetical protein